MSRRHEDLLAGARGAVDRALARRRRVAAGMLVAGLATVVMASPVAGQAPPDGTQPSDDSTAGGGTDPFDAGSEPVASEQVSGDEAPAPAAEEPAPADDGQFATETVVAKGDGGGDVVAASTGGFPLVGGNQFEWFVNTSVSFTTSSSASAAVSDATLTTTVAGVSTLNGGTSSTTLNDAFDGYGGLCLDLGADAGDGAPCDTADSSMQMYNQLGAIAGTECSGREVVFPLAVDFEPGLDVQRKLFVPNAAGTDFARWTNTVTNTSGSEQTVRLTTSNNLGSDSNTQIVSSSSGDAAGDDSDTWVTTFQNFSGTTSSDPRIGHVLGGAGASVSPKFVSFANGDDNPQWSYDLVLAPGQTATVVNYGVVEISRSAANTSSAALAAGTAAHQWDCMTDTERQAVVNFANRALTNPGTNDPASPPTAAFALATSTATEGTTAQVQVVRSGNADEARSFAVSLGGTATSGTDYTAPPLTVDFAAGETTKTISIPITTDAIADAGETIILVLSDPNAPTDPTVAPVVPSALGTITTHVVTLADASQAPTTTTAPSSLPRTGAEVGGLLELAGSAMAAGGAAMYVDAAKRSRARWRRARHKSRS